MKYGVPYTVGGLAIILSPITFGLTRGEISRFLVLLSALGYVSSTRVLSKQGWITTWKKVKDASFNEISEKLRGKHAPNQNNERRRSANESV
jgi:hypothetical protein